VIRFSPTLVALAMLPLAAGQSPPRFVAHTDLVRVDALVTDGRRPISGLGPQDFDIRDNGVAQRIDRVLTGAEPIDAWLLLDESSSVQRELGGLIEAARAFGASLGAADRSGLITFRHAVTVRAPLTLERSALSRQFPLTHAEGYTSMRDAIFLAFARQPDRRARSLIVLFTDGQDTKSWLTDEQIVRFIEQSDVVIYAVTPRDSDEHAGGDDGLAVSWRAHSSLLNELATKSGGERLRLGSGQNLGQVFTMIVNEMKARYLLTYYPSGVTRGGYHRLEVRITQKRLTRVHARSGYFIPESLPASR
jgi:Ca-activated chloride channel family protein